MSQTISTLAPKIVDSLLRFQSRWVLFHSLRAFGMALRTRKMLETSNYRSSYFFGLSEITLIADILLIAYIR